jgi:glycosyltransferase involved in cell wall biosynthesis
MEVVLACSFPRDERLGSSRVPLRLADELGRQGARVSLLFAEDLPRLRAGAGSPRAEQLSAPFRIAAALARRGRGADLVDIAGLDAWAYARLARRLRPRQAIVSRSNGLWDKALAVMGELPQRQRRWRRALGRVYQGQLMCRWERASIVAADLVLFGARADGDEVVRRGWKTPAEVAVVAPGVDDFFASPVPLDARRDVAFVGTFFHRKGSDIAAAAMSRVLAARPALGLTLFGPGLPEAEVRAQFAEAVRPRVTVVDALPSPELARRLGHHAVLLFPTRYEGFGLVVLEAMRAGLAVVTTPTGAGADVVRDGENGLVVPFEDADATAAAVGRAVDDRDLRARLARAAVEEAARRTWSRTATELGAAYERAIARAARRPA